MILSEKYGILFIHIPRTGGNSVSQMLINSVENSDEMKQSYNIEEEWHYSYKQLKRKYGDRIDQLFKFSVVRNPWEWVLSFYFYARQEVNHRFHNECRNITFDFYVKNKHGKYLEYDQTWYLEDEDNNLNLDYICRLDHLDKDFNFIRRRFNFKAEIVHANKSKHRHYREYYTPELREIVGEWMRRDIDNFGFRF